MVEKKVVDYLLEGKKRGFSLQILKHKLIASGWNESTVEEAATFVEKQSQIPLLKKENSSPAAHFSFKSKSNFFKKIGKSITNPNELFEETRNDNFWPALKYFWLISLVPLILFSLFGVVIANIFISMFSTSTINSFSISTIFLYILFSIYIVGTFSLFVFSGALHLLVKLYGGRGNYQNTFSAAVYSSTPTSLFSFIPFVNFVVGIWSFILLIFGLSSYHRFSKIRAFLAAITLVVLIALIILNLVILIPIFYN